MAAERNRVWEPTPDDPALVIVVDEWAELPAEACDYADSIARRGRAVAETLIAAAQRPTQEAMGKGTAVRSQMDIRICLRVREPRDADLILGQGSVNSGWHAHKLTKPGEFLISDPEHAMPERNRAYLLTDVRRDYHAAQCAQMRPWLAASQPDTPHGSPRPAATITPGPTRRCGTRWWTPPRSRSWSRVRHGPELGLSGSRRTPRRAGPSRSGAATGGRSGRLTAPPETDGPRHAPNPAGPRGLRRHPPAGDGE